MKKNICFPESNGTIATIKYQLVKEINHIDGTTYYWTIDREEAMVTNTMTTNKEEAERIFKIVCENNGRTVTKTVLETYYEK